ncbi:MAG: hypothetical protein R3B81_12730 [bacterium]
MRMRSGFALRTGAIGIATAIGALVSATTSGAQEYLPARTLVDVPTAGLVPRGSYETRARVFPAGGLEARVDVGVLNWMSIGVAYGGLRIIGDGRPEWYPRPEFFGRVRVLEETWAWPAFAIGIDTQGAGFWDRSNKRYQFKSRGVYGVVSKNYDFGGDLSLHGGIGRSLDGDGDNTLTPFVGLDKNIFRVVSFAMEYDFAFNDNRDDGMYGQGKGYLNAVLRWNLAPQMQVRFAVRDMLDNSEAAIPGNGEVVVDEGWGRELSFSYVETF